MTAGEGGIIGRGRGERGGVGEEGEIRYINYLSCHNKENLELLTFAFILLI